MADISSTLSFQDHMSAAMQVISNRMDEAAASAKIAKYDLEALQEVEKNAKAHLDALTSATIKDNQAIKEAQKAWQDATKAVDIQTLKVSKYETALLQNEIRLDKMKQQEQQVKTAIDQTTQATQKGTIGFESMQGKIVTLSAAFQLFNQAMGIIRGVNAKINEFVQYSKIQAQAEDQLAIITKQRMALNDDEVRSLYNLASAQQKLGIVGDEAVIKGMAGIASFTTQKRAIEALTPAMNNLAVKTQGYNVTAESMDGISRALGRAMQGDVGQLSRMGVKIDDVTKKRLMHLKEEERAIELAKIIKNVTGDMNEEMAKTPFGQMAQASNSLGDSYERLGSILLPLQATMITVWSNIVENIVNNLDIIAPAVIAALGAISAGFIAMKWEAITAWLAAIAPVAGVIAAIGAVSIALNAMGISFREQVENILISFNWIMTGIKNVGIFFQNVWNFVTNATAMAVDGWKIILSKYFQWVIGNFEVIGKIVDKVFKTDVSSAINNLKNQAKSLENNAKQDTKNRLANMSFKSFEDNSLWFNQQKAQKFMNSFKNGALENRNLLGTTNKNGGFGGIEGLTTNTSGGKALKTQNQGDIKLKDDDIELLHDLATRDYAQYFQQLTPNLTIPSMVIHETADVNQVIGAVANAITGSISSSTTGGYATV